MAKWLLILLGSTSLGVWITFFALFYRFDDQALAKNHPTTTHIRYEKEPFAPNFVKPTDAKSEALLEKLTGEMVSVDALLALLGLEGRR
ncbi:hypothetical protein [Aquibacillus salsiterrae]|uniref:Uncharacterized protein n=1 Tax=Aquibacillus salsiterrae TaxID=2950439 RepID=A0A9X4ADP8_9BACI|nr:hypothetical protein [Aquibacillus salsiterrae]MDC3415777.1 hypothetical protein [Aquibacillus salsiterrae]